MSDGRKARHRALDDWLDDLHESLDLIDRNTRGKTFEDFRDDMCCATTWSVV